MSETDIEITGVAREILDLFERSRRLKTGGLWLNPAAVARNLGRSKNYINTQLRELESAGYVETDGDGYYRIADTGAKALEDM